MASTNRAAGKRLPISCQACRMRKIRCTRDGRPCKTCVRRGLGAEDCIYLGQPRLSTDQGPTSDPQGHNELLARIRNLEGPLHKQAIDSGGSSTGSVSPGSYSKPEGPLAWAPPDCPLLSSIGSLQTFSSGYVRYVPMASQWSSVTVKASSKLDSVQHHESDMPEDEDGLEIPMARNTSLSRSEILTILPPGQYCDSLKETYFRVFSPLFHILHDLTFEAEYQQFRHDAASVSLSWLALLFAILGTAVTALDDGDPLLRDLGREKTVSRNIKVLSSRYRSAAMRCLAADGVISRHSINSLQALLIINHARLHRALPIWTLLGFTYHVAIAMGCHIDPDRFYMGVIEREERRRAWLGLIMLYTTQDSAFGSLDVRFLAQDVQPPSDISDVDLLTGMVPEGQNGPTQMTFLLLKSRLDKVSAMICGAIFGCPPNQGMSIHDLETEIINVQEAVKPRYRLDTSNEESLPAHHLANLNILYSYIHQLYLLLLRPSLCLYFQGEVTSDTCTARLKCATSAKSSLTIHQTLAECTQFAPYKWFNGGLGSFHAFHASVVLAVMLMNPESQAESDELNGLLRQSLDTFAILSSRSQLCSKAVPTLRRILDVATTHQRHQLLSVGQSPSTSSIGYGVSLPSGQETNLDILITYLHPQNWVSPSAVPWDGLGLLGEKKQQKQQTALG